MKAYLIEAEAGEYDDYRSWVCCIFLDKLKAEKNLAEYIASEEKEKKEQEEKGKYYYSTSYTLNEMDVSE